MICKNCNTEIPGHLTSCPKCGSKTDVVENFFCQNCGAKLKGDEDYCEACGVYTQKKKAEMEEAKAVNYSYMWIALVIPLVGLILAIVNSKEHPEQARSCLFAACIGLVIEASVFLPSLFYLL